MTRLYVGNIRYSADEAALRAVFEAFGPVQEVFIGIDRETGRSRGFAFVTMADEGSAQAAREGLNGKEVEGRMLVVSAAQPREARGAGGAPTGRPRDGGSGGERRWERSPGPGAERGSFDGRPGGGRSDGARQSRSDRSGGAAAFRQPPYMGPPPGGRPSRGGKDGGRDRDRAKDVDRDRDRSRDRGRDRPRFDQDDDWA